MKSVISYDRKKLKYFINWKYFAVFIATILGMNLILHVSQDAKGLIVQIITTYMIIIYVNVQFSDTAHFIDYLKLLPIRARDVVRTKFLEYLILFLSMVLVSLVIERTYLDFKRGISSFLWLILGLESFFVLHLPIIFLQKRRRILAILLMMALGIFMIWSAVYSGLSFNETYSSWIGPLTGIGLNVFSYQLAIRVYENREWKP